MLPTPHQTCGGFERLEPDEGKLSRPVLRGGGLSNETSLPDYKGFCPARIKAQGAVTVPAHQLATLIKDIPQGDI
jgi:hypothetical protein